MKRSWISTSRIFRYGINNFTRNAWLSIAATLIMLVTLTVIVTSFMTRVMLTDTLSYFKQKADLSIYLSDEVTPDQLKKLETAIHKNPIVVDIEYTTKEQAKATFQKDNSSQLDVLEGLKETQANPFPASLRVSTTDPSKLGEISDFVAKNYSDYLIADKTRALSNNGSKQEAIDKIGSWARAGDIIGIVTSVIFTVISCLIVFNTIRMAIFNRREEIQMMRLIGATPQYIRGPFLVEASLYGVLAATITMVVLYAVILPNFSQIVHGIASDIQVGSAINYMQQWPVLVAIVLAFIGILIGMLSSLLAMRRYLKT
jgi:cell division transport system permease protein